MAFANTLDGRDILQEGWLTVYKSRNPTFLTKQKPDRVLERAWGVLHATSSKGPLLSFYQDNHKESRVLRREKIELLTVRMVTRILDNPKHSNCFTLKIKGKRNRILFDCDSDQELQHWISRICDLMRLEFKMEKVIWEYLGNDGLWMSLPDKLSFQIEAHYCEQRYNFGLGDTQDTTFHYHLSNMHRIPSVGSKHTQRIKRSPFIWDKPETLHQKMKDLPAIWEWGDPDKGEWHPFERDTNIQIEEMYDSGSQWAELTLCIPSPMLLLLNLQDMKLVNSRTTTRYCLRRVDNSSNMTPVGGNSGIPDPRSPSPDDDADESQGAGNGVSPVSPLFQPLQACLAHLQFPRKNISYKELIGEGAFGEVYLVEITGLVRSGKTINLVAVKQLRLSDFIARHGHHSQQMEDFLREAKEMAKVTHHRVVKLLAVCTLDYPLLLIEEYMNHGDLLGVLKDSRPYMPLVLQLSFSWQIADGMNYLANDLQCVHRDLAARNVMVHKEQNGDMIVKIADFGLSRHLYSEMYKHQGTKPRPLPAKWMALESLMYFVFSTRSDVWSFGVLLWEIMTLGRTPYPGVENRELLEQIEEHGLKLNKPKSCPIVLYDIILDCTRHEPDDRRKFGDLKDTLYGLYEEAQAGTLVLVNDPDDDISNGEKKTNSSDQSEDLTEEKKFLQDGGDENKGKEETITQQDEATHKQDDVTEEVKVPTDSPVDITEPHTDTKTGNESNVESEEDQTPKINSSQSEENTKRPSPLEKLDEKPDEKPTSVINLDEIDIGEIPSSLNESLKEVSEIGHLYYVIEDSSQESPPDSLKHGEGDVILHNDEIDVVIENESDSNILPPNGTVNSDRTSQ